MKRSIPLLITAAIILAGCSAAATGEEASQTSNFKGEKGSFVAMENNAVTLEASSVDDGNAHYYNTTLPSGDPVYFFVVKSPDGNLRAAANGCQVCGGALQGFHQEGDVMVCNTCGNRYPLNKIATEKGGCNPAPISQNLQVDNGKIKISLDDLQDVRQFFE